MDGDLITMEILMSELLFRPVLINTGYEYYSIMNKDLVMRLRLPRVKILLKLVTGFIKENTEEPGVEIIKIIKFFMNI